MCCNNKDSMIFTAVGIKIIIILIDTIILRLINFINKISQIITGKNMIDDKVLIFLEKCSKNYHEQEKQDNEKHKKLMKYLYDVNTDIEKFTTKLQPLFRAMDELKKTNEADNTTYNANENASASI